MKNPVHALLLFALSASLFPVTAQPRIDKAPQPGKPFFLIQISDPQLGFREEQGFAEGERLLTETVDAINALHPAFVIVTGDMINSSGNEEQLAAYKRLIARIREDIPVFHLPGNHDIGKYTPEHIRSYLDRFGYERFAFRYGDCAFIGINSCPIKEGCTGAEAEQYDWLCGQLDAMKDCRAAFVFMHHPPVLQERNEPENYSNLSESMRQRYIGLFARNGVDAVFAGHLHATAYCEIDGLKIITCGPSGKPLGKGFSGMNVITVYADSSFSSEYVKPSTFNAPFH